MVTGVHFGFDFSITNGFKFGKFHKRTLTHGHVCLSVPGDSDQHLVLL